MRVILDYLTDGALTLLVSTPIYIFFRLFFLKCTRQKSDKKREILLGVFWLYLFWLASETVLPEFSFTMNAVGRPTVELNSQFHIPAAQRLDHWIMINLRPLETIRRYTSFSNFGASAVNLVGNVVMFLPLGSLIPVLWKKMRSFWTVALIGFCSSCLIECVQLFIDRSVDVDDVLLNTAGVLLGYLWIQLLFWLFPKIRSGR